MAESTSKQNLVGPIAFILAINLAMIIVGSKYDDMDLWKGQVKVFYQNIFQWFAILHMYMNFGFLNNFTFSGILLTK